MNTCKTCKWWQMGKDGYVGEIVTPIDLNTFEPSKLEFEIKYCLSPLLLFFERPTVSNGACVVDSYEHTASLITASDFGCVNWEAE